MTMTPVNSSVIAAIGYEDRNLAVRFLMSGRTYTHHGVPYGLFIRFMMAGSKGHFYNSYLRGRFH